MKKYEPKFLYWTKSLDHEIKTLRKLILCNAGDRKMLVKEYFLLTGKRFKRRKYEN